MITFPPIDFKETIIVKSHVDSVSMSTTKSRLTRICICENKGAAVLRGNLIRAFHFATILYQISSLYPLYVALQPDNIGL